MNSIEIIFLAIQTLPANQSFPHNWHDLWQHLDLIWSTLILPFLGFIFRKKLLNIFAMANFFSKVSLLFKNFSEVKNYIVKIYEILIHLKPVIQFADMLIPNETKVQIKFDSVTSVVYPALEKAISALETASDFLGIPLPVVKSVGVNADAVAALKKVVNS